MNKIQRDPRRVFHCGRDGTSILLLTSLRKAFAAVLPILAVVTITAIAHAETIVAKISSVNGTVQIVRGGKILAAKNGMAIRVHDKVVTGTDGSVTIVMPDHNLLHLGQSGRLLIGKSRTSSNSVAPGSPDLLSDQ